MDKPSVNPSNSLLMDNTSSIVSQLRDSPTAGLVKEITCCKRAFTITLPSGVRSTASSIKHFVFEDGQGRPFLDAKYRAPCCALPEMEVRFLNTPPLKVIKKSMVSRSVLVVNEYDEPVLRIQRPAWMMVVVEYTILGDNNIEIGKIKRDWLEHDIYFPVDLDVRYKAALLASCIYMNILNSNRH